MRLFHKQTPITLCLWCGSRPEICTGNHKLSCLSFIPSLIVEPQLRDEWKRLKTLTLLKYLKPMLLNNAKGKKPKWYNTTSGLFNRQMRDIETVNKIILKKKT
jgi:hypothetical protein